MMPIAYTARSFKFRAECQQDVIRFLESLNARDIRIANVEMEELIPDMPDCVVALTLKRRGSLTAEFLHEIAARLKDCHVIAETIAYEEDYTGNRDYSFGHVAKVNE